MYLVLNVDGMKIRFQISRYVHDTTVENFYDHWCNVDVNFSFPPVISYDNHGEILESGEVECLRDRLGALLEGKIENRETVEFLEPDLVFVLLPKKEGSYETDVDISVEWRVYLWSDGYPTENALSVSLGREEIALLHAYLMLVTKKYSSGEAIIRELTERGILYSYDDESSKQVLPPHKELKFGYGSGNVEEHFIYLSCEFEFGNRSYYYRTEDETIRIGDFVRVPVGENGRTAVVEVVDIEYFTQEDAPMSPDRVKFIVGKVDEEKEK